MTLLEMPLRVIFLRDTYRNLEDSTLKTWFDWFPKDVVCEWRASDQTAYLPMRKNKRSPWIRHEILFRHGQTAADASAFLSTEYGIIVLEEVVPAFMSTGLVSPGIDETIFDMALQRVVQRGVKEPEVLLTCNPPPLSHWSSKRIIDITEEERKDLNWEHYWFPPEENEENLRPGYYQELMKSLPEHLVERFIKGQRVSLYPGVPVFRRDFNEAIHVRPTLKAVEHKPLIFGFDAGLTPACLVTQIDARGRWLWLQEFQGGYVDGKLAEQIGARRFAQTIRPDIRLLFPHQTFGPGYADPACWSRVQTDESTVAEIWADEGFDIQPGEEGIPARVESIRGRLQQNIEGEPALLISRQGCPIMCEALSGGYRYATNIDGTNLIGREPMKNEFSHLMDAAGYIGSILFPPQFSLYKERKTSKVRVESDFRIF